MLTDEVALLHVTNADDGNGRFVWWIFWILYQAWFSEGVVVGVNVDKLVLEQCWRVMRDKFRVLQQNEPYY